MWLVSRSSVFYKLFNSCLHNCKRLPSGDLPSKRKDILSIYTFKNVYVEAITAVCTKRYAIQNGEITVWKSWIIKSIVYETEWGSRLPLFHPFSEVFKLTLKTMVQQVCAYGGILGTSESGCWIKQKEQVDRMMIFSPSVLSKYRWYSV